MEWLATVRPAALWIALKLFTKAAAPYSTFHKATGWHSSRLEPPPGPFQLPTMRPAALWIALLVTGHSLQNGKKSHQQKHPSDTIPLFTASQIFRNCIMERPWIVRPAALWIVLLRDFFRSTSQSRERLCRQLRGSLSYSWSASCTYSWWFKLFRIIYFRLISIKYF